MAREAVKAPGDISVFGPGECMYACPGCYQAYAEKWKHNLGDKPRFMPLATFKRIVDEFSPHRTKIGLYSPGENFLNPDVYDMITYAQEQGCPVECDTTGAPMDPERLTDHVLDLLRRGVPAADFLNTALNHLAGLR